uniref:Uncharacterized protein n=1 Tax=Oryza nivara TaxID=4536 RepID=A0A0E0IUJ2_ORYNI
MASASMIKYGENVLEAKKNPDWICPVVSLGYKSVAHYLIATQRASPSGSADSNKVAATKPEASSESEVTDKAPAAKEDLEDAEMSGQAIQKVEADHQVNNPPDDSDNDDSTSETVVTSDSQDCQVNLDIGCATPSKPTGPKKRKWIERSPDCVASRLRSRSNKS